MSNITILDPQYKEWVKELSLRYRKSQIKAAVRLNREKLLFNWQLGRDIVEMHVEERWGESVIKQLSTDLSNMMPGVEGLSRTNIYNCKRFYLLYNQYDIIVQQVVGLLKEESHAGTPELVQQVVGLFQIPWGHHCVIIDNVKGNMDKALFLLFLNTNWRNCILKR